MKKSILEKFSLKGKVAVISGTTRGLGQSLAEALAEAGASVVALDRSDTPHMRRFCKAAGTPFERIRVDLVKASKKDLERIAEGIVKKHSRVDILVNNAGISRRGEVWEFTEKDWRDVLKVNLTVPFCLSRAFAKTFMQQGSGKIINIASMLSFQGGIRRGGPYQAHGLRVGQARHQRQRHSSGLYGHEQHGAFARRRPTQRGHFGTHSRRTLGHARGCPRCGGIPRFGSQRLHQRVYNRRGRRLAGAINSCLRP